MTLEQIISLTVDIGTVLASVPAFVALLVAYCATRRDAKVVELDKELRQLKGSRKNFSGDVGGLDRQIANLQSRVAREQLSVKRTRVTDQLLGNRFLFWLLFAGLVLLVIAGAGKVILSVCAEINAVTASPTG